jgi:WD40 repeat protein
MQFTGRVGWPLWLVVAGIGFSALADPHSVSAEHPKEQASFGGHTAVVSSVAVTADGKTLASGSYDATIKLWDLATGKEIAPLLGHTAAVYSVAFAPDGKTLASGSHDDTARLWDVASRKEIATLRHAYHVKRVVFTPDGKTLITAGERSSSGTWPRPRNEPPSTS